jgi:hypothetical protein
LVSAAKATVITQQQSSGHVAACKARLVLSLKPLQLTPCTQKALGNRVPASSRVVSTSTNSSIHPPPALLPRAPTRTAAVSNKPHNSRRYDTCTCTGSLDTNSAGSAAATATPRLQAATDALSRKAHSQQTVSCKQVKVPDATAQCTTPCSCCLSLHETLQRSRCHACSTTANMYTQQHTAAATIL